MTNKRNVTVKIEPRGMAGGAAGGLVGGVLFGIMMTAMGMMEMVAGLVESDSVGVGWAVHLVISVVFGLAYALLLGTATTGYGRRAWLGAAFGVAVWILGALLIMPLWMGMTPLVLGEPQMMSLVGHLAYGVALGLVHQAVSVGDTPSAQRVRA
jgi:uncharacterized membrane protein YagU involved in acid resistance